MKRPVLEVIRFDEADIITSSGRGFTTANFGNTIFDDGIFTFFGGTGTGSVKTEAGHNGVLKAFNSYFGGNWGSTNEILVDGGDWNSPLDEIIRRDRGDDSDSTDYQYYNGTYYYTFFSDPDSGFYYFRSH